MNAVKLTIAILMAGVIIFMVSHLSTNQEKIECEMRGGKYVTTFDHFQVTIISGQTYLTPIYNGQCLEVN